jgi:hypothetical protein
MMLLTLNYEEPLPSTHAMLVIKRGKGCCCNQACKGDGENIARV